MKETWYVVPRSENSIVLDHLWPLFPYRTYEEYVTIKGHYGKIEAGQYRIVKTLHAGSSGQVGFVVAPFTVHPSKGIDWSQFEKSSYDILKQKNDVTLEVKEETVTPGTEEIILIYTNLSDREYV